MSVKCCCHGWKNVKRNVRSSDGNLVNLGNFDADGVNGNRWKPDNREGNIGVSLSRSVAKLAYLKGEFCVCLIQPPSCLPISCSRSSYCTYQRCSRAFTSFANLIVIFAHSSDMLAFARIYFLWYGSLVWYAVTTRVSTSSKRLSVFCPSNCILMCTQRK